MKNNGRHLAIVAVLVVIGTVITYFILTAVYQLPTGASLQAVPIDTMFNVHFALISFFFALIIVFVLYSVVVFRRKPGDEEDGPHVHGNTPLEIVWTILPLIIVIALGVWAAFVLGDVTAESPDQMVVRVTGRQWSWTFSYPDYEEVGVSQQLVLPVNKPIRLELVTEDVLHSFWVPEFRVKQDLVPGSVETLAITPTKTGTYMVRCAEICGFSHTNMLAEVKVVTQQEFEQWLADQSVSLANLAPEERGQKWATDFGCVACHSVDGTDMAGPSWLGVYGSQESLADGTTVTVDDAYLQESILNPGAKIVAGYQNIMPANFADQFAAKQDELAATGVEVDIVADLIAYISSVTE